MLGMMKDGVLEVDGVVVVVEGGEEVVAADGEEDVVVDGEVVEGVEEEDGSKVSSLIYQLAEESVS